MSEKLNISSNWWEKERRVLLYESERQGKKRGKREREPCIWFLESGSCQPGISRMSRKPTIGSSLYTLEDRILILIHYK